MKTAIEMIEFNDNVLALNSGYQIEYFDFWVFMIIEIRNKFAKMAKIA